MIKNIINKQLLCINILIYIVITISFGKHYYIGGDASQYFYVEPELFFNHHYLYNLHWGNSLAGQGHIFSQVYQAPFFYLLNILKKLTPEFINTQALIFTINILVAYNAFRILISKFTDKNFHTNIIINLAPLIYVINPFTYTTIQTHGLHAYYLLSYFPILIVCIFYGGYFG